MIDEQPIKINLVITFWRIFQETKDIFLEVFFANIEVEILEVAGAQNLFEAATTLVTPFQKFMFKGGFKKEIHEEKSRS